MGISETVEGRTKLGTYKAFLERLRELEEESVGGHSGLHLVAPPRAKREAKQYMRPTTNGWALDFRLHT